MKKKNIYENTYYNAYKRFLSDKNGESLDQCVNIDPKIKTVISAELERPSQDIFAPMQHLVGDCMHEQFKGFLKVKKKIQMQPPRKTIKSLFHEISFKK